MLSIGKPFLARTVRQTAFLGIASFAFFATGITNPGDTLFDEKLYVDAGNAVLAGTTDPSPYGPPLGKLMLPRASICLATTHSAGGYPASFSAP
jgi:hypothetical protein